MTKKPPAAQDKDRKLLCQIAARLYAVDLADDIQREEGGRPVFSIDAQQDRAARAVSGAFIILNEIDAQLKGTTTAVHGALHQTAA
jgi:hypothetical protein